MHHKCQHRPSDAEMGGSPPSAVPERRSRGAAALAAIESLRLVQTRDNALIRADLGCLVTRAEFNDAITALAHALEAIDADQAARWNHLETQLAAIVKRLNDA